MGDASVVRSRCEGELSFGFYAEWRQLICMLCEQIDKLKNIYGKHLAVLWRMRKGCSCLFEDLIPLLGCELLNALVYSLFCLKWFACGKWLWKEPINPVLWKQWSLAALVASTSGLPSVQKEALPSFFSVELSPHHNSEVQKSAESSTEQLLIGKKSKFNLLKIFLNF